MRLLVRSFLAPAFVLALACSSLNRESGVCLPNQMDKIAWGYVEQHKMLEPGEKLLAYYDDTVSLDGTRLSVVTNKRLVTYVDGNLQSIGLAEIARVERVDVPLALGIQVVGTDGMRLQVDIALANGGETFESVLKDAWKAQKGGG
jgi:hypothetical protein